MENKKKLLIFEPLSHIAGGQMVLINLLPFLMAEFSVTVALPGDGPLKKKLDEMGINSIFLNPGSYALGRKNIGQVLKYLYYLPAFLSRAFFLIKKFDLLYVNGARLLPLVAGADIWPAKAIIWHSHSLISDKKSLWLVEKIARQKKIKKIIAVSQALVSRHEELRQKTAVVYNGVNAAIFYPSSSPQKTDLKTEIGLLGDLLPGKGHLSALKALAQLKQENWHLNIVGGARPGQEKFVQELKELALELKITDRVSFWGRQDKAADYLRAWDLLILPSIVFEACPLVVLEAMACGVPIIASNLGGTPELITDGQNGYLYDNRDENALPTALKKFFSLPATEKALIGQKAHDLFLEKYELKDMAQKIINLIKESL